MDYILELKRLFEIEDITYTEKMKVVMVGFSVNDIDKMPSFQNIKGYIGKLPKRDKINIYLKDDTEDQYIFSDEKEVLEDEYVEFCQDARTGNAIHVNFNIEKSVVNNTFSVYNFDCFVNNILELTYDKVLLSFALLYESSNKLIFEVFNQPCFFKTKTMIFSSRESTKFDNNFERTKRLEDCKDVTYFFEMTKYPLLPDDFAIEVSGENDKLEHLFNKLSTVLSLIYISSSSYFNMNETRIQISGQKNIESVYNNKEIISNLEIYKIYNWIYTDGNAIDKAMIARNIISLHCKYDKIIELDGKTLESIKSNYNLYLKSNVAQYIELRNKLAEFINESISKTGEYAIKLLDNFKSNIMAICALLFTVGVSNTVSNRPLNNIFTRDINIILEIFLFISSIYLCVSRQEISYKKNKAKETYYELKENYSSLLTKEDLKEVFEDDKLINNMLDSVDQGIRMFSVIWCACIILGFILIEFISDNPVITPFIIKLIGNISKCK